VHDLLGYIGSSVNSTDVVVIHLTAFSAIGRLRSYLDILVGHPYRADVAANPYHFAEQLPFYSIQPLYVALISGLQFPRVAGTVSAVTNFALAVVLRCWLAPCLNGLGTAAACTLIMLSPNILVLCRWATPECLATVVAALALYLILERKVYFWGSSLLVFNVWVHTGAPILAGLVFALLFFMGKLDLWLGVTLSVISWLAISPSTILAATMAGLLFSTTPFSVDLLRPAKSWHTSHFLRIYTRSFRLPTFGSSLARFPSTYSLVWRFG